MSKRGLDIFSAVAVAALLGLAATTAAADQVRDSTMIMMDSSPMPDQYGMPTVGEWDDIPLKPDTATRWPTWNEVTGKPSTFPTTWEQVLDKPATFPTRWDQIDGIPDGLGAAHNHDDRYLRIAKSGPTNAVASFPAAAGSTLIFGASGAYGVRFNGEAEFWGETKFQKPVSFARDIELGGLSFLTANSAKFSGSVRFGEDDLHYNTRPRRLDINVKTTLGDELQTDGILRVRGSMIVQSPYVDFTTAKEVKMNEAEITQLKTRNMELRDNLTVGKRLTVGGKATFENDVDISQRLNVGRPATFNDSLSVDGSVSVDGNVSLGGAFWINRDDVSGERWCRATSYGRLTCNHNIPAPEFRLTLGSSGGCPVVNLQQRSGSWQTVSSITIPCDG